MSKETIGSRIKAFRRSRGLTQEQLAKDLGYSHKSVITHIEKGESEMSYEKMLLLLRTYVADANELFDPKEVEHIDKLIEKERKRPKHDAVVIYIHGLYGNHQEAKFYKFLKDYDNIVFHTDASQAIGKVDIDYSYCDLITIAPHKFYGMNGVSVLVKKKRLI